MVNCRKIHKWYRISTDSGEAGLGDNRGGGVHVN